MEVRSLDETSFQLSQSLGDRYAIERQLGRGGMATVYLVSLPGGAPLKVSVEVTPVNAANVLHRRYFSGISCGDAAR